MRRLLGLPLGLPLRSDVNGPAGSSLLPGSRRASEHAKRAERMYSDNLSFNRQTLRVAKAVGIPAVKDNH